MTCTCGHAKADHDTADPVDWPCEECECDNFDEAEEQTQ